MTVAPIGTLKENLPQNKMELQLRHHRIHFPRRPLLMGILNITDDSFSGDGCMDPERALDRARQMVARGADLIDVGAESARTNRKAISPAEEIERLVPVLEGFSAAGAGVKPRDGECLSPPLLSVNTWRPEVAAAALEAGADLLNDMSALPDDRNARLCARHGAALLIMHSVGAPKIAHTHVQHVDIMATLHAFFEEKIALAEKAGLPSEAIVLDPGIDFAKQASDNLRIFRELENLLDLQRPILLPISRKGVIGDVLDQADPRERDAGTAACLVAGMRRGASLFRVHNVEMAWQTRQSILPLSSPGIGECHSASDSHPSTLKSHPGF